MDRYEMREYMHRRYQLNRELHLCVRCGEQDDRTRAGRTLCESCWKDQSERDAKRRKRLRSAGCCISCGNADDRTKAGLMLCARCALVSNRANKRYHDRARGKGLCTHCGKRIPEPGHRTCRYCLDRQREQRGGTKADG